MAKISKALTVSKPRSLVPRRTVDAQIEVLPPAKGGSQLATRQAGELATRDGGQLTVPKTGGKTVVVSNSQTETDAERRRRIGSGEIEAMNAGGHLPGLVKAKDAVALLAKYGVPVGQAMEATKPLVLSMGNKRKYETLADGTRIHRRLGGTGYDGKNNAGQFQKGGSRSKAGSGSAGGGTSEDPFAYVTKKRTKVGKVGEGSPGGEDPSDNPQRSLPPSSGTPGKAAPLQLGDAPKAARPGRSAAASGFAADSGFAVSDDMQKTANKLAGKAGKAAGERVVDVGTGVVENLKNYVEDVAFKPVKKFQKMSEAEKAEGFKLKSSAVKAAWKEGNYAKAIDLAFSGVERWASEAQQEAAQKFVEKQLQ